MSRIAGIISNQSHRQTPKLLLDAMKILRSDVSWKQEITSLKNLSFGWAGRGTPNHAKCGDVVAFMDGFIYNRHEFESTVTDAELLIRLHLHFGFEQALKKINGDFSVALYDLNSATLWLGRDRLGVKPLYYISKPDFFAFASRPGALLPLLNGETDVNRQYVAIFAASHYRYFDYETNWSPFAKISQLPAAQILRLQNAQATKTTYWSIPNLPEFTESEDVLAERYRDLLLDAVSLRLKRAQRAAFTLSGGMDSSSVLASAVKISGAKQNVFSTVYTDATYDETNEIQSMLDSSAAMWHAIRVDQPDVFAVADKMIGFHDEPIATATWLSHFLLCEEVKAQGFDGLFGGLGGDELNAGEYEYYFFYFADLRREGKEEELKREVELWAQYHDHPIYKKNFSVMESELREMVDLTVAGRCLPSKKRMLRYVQALNPNYFNLKDFEPILENPFSSYLQNRTYQDLTKETTPCSLRAEDRQSLAFGLDCFLPFFDHRLVEFMFRIPKRLKIKNGITKHLLRRAMKGILPEETRTRIKKTGWNAPAHLWFVHNCYDQLLDLIHSQKFRKREIYNANEVERIVKEHVEIVQSGRNEENHMMFLWQLVNLELWFRKYIDR